MTSGRGAGQRRPACICAARVDGGAGSRREKKANDIGVTSVRSGDERGIYRIVSGEPIRLFEAPSRRHIILPEAALL